MQTLIRNVIALAVAGSLFLDVFAQSIPDPIATGPGCWEWAYDPKGPIPEDAKVVPGVCPTVDGRCYVVPSSGCFEITGVDEPVFPEGPATPAPPPIDSPPGDPILLPKEPLQPTPVRPTNPSGHVPVPAPTDGQCTPGTGWDFEWFLENLNPLEAIDPLRGYASLEGWQGAGTPGRISPFEGLENEDVSWKAAPVYGNAIPIERIRPPGWRPDIAALIGGDYWRFSQDINQSGDFWIGSLDRRYSWKHHPGESWGEEAVGTLTSPECTLRARYLSFRIGGSAHGSQRVEVLVAGAQVRQYFGVRFSKGPGDPSLKGAMGFPTQYGTPQAPQYFPPPVNADGWTAVRSAMPDHLNSDWMQTFVFDLEPFVNRRVRIRIVDDRRDECASWDASQACLANKPEHLQADDFSFLSQPPEGTKWLLHSDGTCGGVPDAGEGCSPIGRVPSAPPLWGTTDVHAHPMANTAFGGHVMWGDPADPLHKVYDCRNGLDPISGTGGRPEINPSHRRTSCYLHGALVAIATGILHAGCTALNIVPFVGSVAFAACAVAVAAAQAVAATTPVMSGATLHGASKFSSGAVKFGVLFEGLLNVIPDLELGFEVGLLPQTDSFRPATGKEAFGWWEKDKEWHSPTGLGKTHNAYQVDMIRRAFHGGMRLAVWDVINSRVFGLAADGSMTSDWHALKVGTDAAKRIVAIHLKGIAQIAFSPAEAESIIRSGRMAIILGSEVDELGRMRPTGLPWPRSPHVGPDSMQKQIDDLWELGIRKLTPIHATNNPIGGTALISTKYDALNFFISGTEPDQALTLFDLPLVKLVLNDSFGSLMAGLVLGHFSLLADPVQPSSPLWNPTNWFDFDIRPNRTDDDLVGDYERITYRIGIDGFGGTSLRDPMTKDWLPPSAVLGNQVQRVRLLKGLALAVTGANCDLRNTVLPEKTDSFGPTVDEHYVQIAGHRNALGLHRVDGINDGAGFLRAAMKKGMLIDTDHFSQNTRIDVYRLADLYAKEAGWPGGECQSADDPVCGSYPLVGVHSKVRGLEIDPKRIEEMRNAYGFNDEASRSEREIKQTAENGGTFAVFPLGSVLIPPNTKRCTKDSDCANYTGLPGACAVQNDGTSACKIKAEKGQPGLVPALAVRDFELPPEVRNDCDGSSKTFAVKYLWLMKTTRGRGLTPATDLNGLFTTLRPRYGRSLPWNVPCGRNDRDGTDQANVAGQPKWSRLMVDGQEHESSAVWYDDYAGRGPTPSPTGLHWNDMRYKQVVARSATESREDEAPRAQADDVVFFNDFGPDLAGPRGYRYQEGNRPGAQLAPMKRWRMLPGRGGWDFNLDGLQHIGLYPDLFQDMRNVGVQWEQMGPLFHAARDYIATWQRAVAIGAAHPLCRRAEGEDYCSSSSFAYDAQISEALAVRARIHFC